MSEFIQEVSKPDWDRSLKIILDDRGKPIRPIAQFKSAYGEKNDPFEETALELYYGFLKKVQKTDLDACPNVDKKVFRRVGIESGFLAIGKIIGLSTMAYANYLELNEQPTATLPEILRAPSSFKNTAYFLARMPNEINKIYEQNIGLTGNTYPRETIGLLNINCGLVIEDCPDSGPTLTIPRWIIRNSVLDPENIVTPTNPSEVCGAISGPQKKVWDMTIDLCEARKLLG